MFRRYWGEVEADFQQWYGIGDPLGLQWRRLRVLAQNLPYESRVMFRIRELKEFGGDPGAPDWLAELNRIRGVRPDKVTRL